MHFWLYIGMRHHEKNRFMLEKQNTKWTRTCSCHQKSCTCFQLLPTDAWANGSLRHYRNIRYQKELNKRCEEHWFPLNKVVQYRSHLSTSKLNFQFNFAHRWCRESFVRCFPLNSLLAVIVSNKFLCFISGFSTNFGTKLSTINCCSLNKPTT